MSLFSRRIKKSFNKKARDFVWPRIGWSRVFSYYRKRLFRIKDNASAIACGVACGVAVSMTPFIGLHLLVTAGACLMLRGNIIAGMIGTLVGNPITFPFIWIISYYIGTFILGIEADPTALKAGLSYDIIKTQFMTLFLPLVLGGVLIAIPAWFATYYPIKNVITRYQEMRKKRMSEKKKLLRAIKDMLEKRKMRKNLFKNKSLDKILFDASQGDFKKLGEGVWSAVYDLENGCVIKVSKEDGGIGSGFKKIENERFYLKEIENLKMITPFEVPQLIDFGKIKRYTPLRHLDYRFWTILSKLDGFTLNHDLVAALPTAKQETLIKNITSALYSLHKIFDRLPKDQSFENIYANDAFAPANTSMPSRLDKAKEEFIEIGSLSRNDIFYSSVIDELIQIFAYQFDDPSRLVHGDYNLSNIFFSDDLRVIGILDFAETGIGFIEKDVAKLIAELPSSLKNNIIQSYQEDSGIQLNPVKIQYYLTVNALYSSLITEFRRDTDNKDRIKEAKDILKDNLTQLKEMLPKKETNT